MATDISFETTTIPERDETPSLDLGPDYDPAYPGSTKEAPYGYKADGTPYKRRPGGGGGKGKGKRLPASESQARAAAGLLGRLNLLVGMAMVAPLPDTAAALVENNEQFEQMAYEALLTDPTLCRKILSAGQTSGKAGLIMAYGMLGVSILPAARSEIAAKRAEREREADEQDIQH